MKVYYLLLLLLSLTMFSCSQQNSMDETLNKIDLENLSLKAVRVQYERDYKFNESALFNYTIVNRENGRIVINNETHSFLSYDEDGELYFYDSFQDSLYISDNTSGDVWVLCDNFISEHQFVLNPKKYWNGNFAKKFSKVPNDKSEILSQIDFTMRSINVNMQIDKVFVKSTGIYLIDNKSYFIHSFVKEIDPELIAGDGVYKETYQLFHNIDENSIERINGFVDSVILMKVCCGFPEYYEIDTQLLYANQNCGRGESQEDTLLYNGYLKTIDGDSLTLSDLKSDYILMDFWFARCPGCIHGIPHMNALSLKYSDEKFMVIGVNPVDKQIDALKDYIRKMNMIYPVYVSGKSFAEHYQIKSYPTYILIDNRNDDLSIIGSYSIMDDLNDVLEELE